METIEQRVRRLISEDVSIVPYDPRWPESFQLEKAHLLSCLPSGLVKRIEHFGSTAIRGMAAKPIIDMLVEVSDLEATKVQIAPLLEAQGYDYVWRPSHGNDGLPFYAWFIKRDRATGSRTHHIHMVEADFVEHWNRLLFRDYLIAHPHVAREYETLKMQFAKTFANDRVAYTNAKTAFIVRVTKQARNFYGATVPRTAGAA